LTLKEGRLRNGKFRPFPVRQLGAIISPMSRQQKDPVHIAKEELRSLLKWGVQTRHDNIADALRRVLGVLSRKG
jgi:hypothetical protein